jgi:hypothetical protein
VQRQCQSFLLMSSFPKALTLLCSRGKFDSMM